MIIGADGPAVIVTGRTAAWLERNAGLSSLRVRVRGADPALSRQLEDLRIAALHWRGSATGTEEAAEPEPGASSSLWMSTTAAAQLLGITPRGVRRAIARGALPAVEVAGRHRISREDVEHYRAARAA